jgi:hypothetical protein
MLTMNAFGSIMLMGSTLFTHAVAFLSVMVCTLPVHAESAPPVPAPAYTEAYAGYSQVSSLEENGLNVYRPAITTSNELTAGENGTVTGMAASTNLANRIYSANTGTIRLERGKIFRLRVLDEVNSTYAKEGEAFSAYVDEPIFSAQGQTVIPRGSLLRGRVMNVQRSRFFGKGGSFVLSFDNITLPSGDILPVDLQLSSLNQHDELVKNDGRVYEDPGFANKFTQTLDKSGYILSDITRKGYEAGKDTGGKVLGAVTGTVSAVGGAFAAAGYTVGKSVYHAVAKGAPADVTKEDALYTLLIQDADVPIL